ncbi:unnamed protein product [Strongylus vulgaris]|uniref:G-protein coupled receptors family 1 profile domain-containing protein n=1 Tax=Strongylus vulgaris TaxID=40348 RepID=A0A3P7IN71_STRVU|nr:unnamed protein product [Strongylus vulgaris]
MRYIGMLELQHTLTEYWSLGTAVAAFYLPVTIMIILYSRVYWETRKRRKEFGRLQASQVRISRKFWANLLAHRRQFLGLFSAQVTQQTPFVHVVYAIL